MCLSGAHLRFWALPWRSWQRPRAQTRNHILGVRAQGPGPAGRPGTSCFPVRPVRRPCPQEPWGERVHWGWDAGQSWAALGEGVVGAEKVLKGPAWLLSLLQCHPARELVVHAATLFGDLHSFMKQALDQAEATQALWHTLSSRLRVRVWPEGHQGRSFVGQEPLGGFPIWKRAGG